MKAQVKNSIFKKISIAIIFSIIFSTCVSGKINVYAANVDEPLSYSTLYEICLFVGNFTGTSIGVGYPYSDEDDVAKLGKEFIDSLSDIPSVGWFIGSHTTSGNFIYGIEAFEQIKATDWSLIVGAGSSNLNTNCYYFTSDGYSYFTNSIKSLLDGWVNGETNFFHNKFGYYNDGFYHLRKNSAGNYVGFICFVKNGVYGTPTYLESTKPIGLYNAKSSGSNTVIWKSSGNSVFGSKEFSSSVWENVKVVTDLPYFENSTKCNNFLSSNGTDTSEAKNRSLKYYVLDWNKDFDNWNSALENYGKSLYTLADSYYFMDDSVFNILTSYPDSSEYMDIINESYSSYTPSTESITKLVYYSSTTNTSPKLSASEIPNYEEDDNLGNGDHSDSPFNFDYSNIFTYANSIVDGLMPILYVVVGLSFGFSIVYLLKNSFFKFF